MAIIYSYPNNSAIQSSDRLIGTSTIIAAGKKKNLTKSFTIAALGSFVSLNHPTPWGTIIGDIEVQTDLWNILESKQGNITLTTSGVSGPSTFIDNVLNIPDYSEGFTIPTLQEVTTTGNITTNSISIIDNGLNIYNTILTDGSIRNSQFIAGDIYMTSIPEDIDDPSYLANYNSSGVFLQYNTDALVYNGALSNGQLFLDWATSGGALNGAVSLISGSPTEGGGKIILSSNDINGSIEINNITDNIVLEFPNKSAGTYTIAMVDDIPSSFGLFAQTADGGPVTATTTETTIIGSGVGTLTVPANVFKVGDSFAASLDGVISCVGSATIHVRVKTLTGTLLADTGIIDLDTATSKSWLLNLYFTVRTIGAAGSASISSGGLFSYVKNSGTNFEGYVLNTVNTTTFDTTINNTLNITVEWNTNNAGNSILSRNFTLTRIY